MRRGRQIPCQFSVVLRDSGWRITIKAINRTSPLDYAVSAWSVASHASLGGLLSCAPDRFPQSGPGSSRAVCYSIIVMMWFQATLASTPLPKLHRQHSGFRSVSLTEAGRKSGRSSRDVRMYYGRQRLNAEWGFRLQLELESVARLSR
jgi:hypothetical protein